MIEAGTVLQNRYLVEKQIGQGGMGAVFVATDERFGSTVAIKETLLLDEKYRKAFEREARLLNSLRHAALPRVSDHFADASGQFLVMEYIDGEDLSEMMEHEGKTFPVKEVLGWADQLLDALEYLHAQEMPVIHRDIKPQNLKLNSRGQIILLDFGLAKGNVSSPESNTAAKSVFGYSRSYASLEQIQGTGTDPRSDLYSLAATLYHLLTGVPPADALTRAMNVLSEKDDPLVPLNTINPDIPASIAEVLQKAMALNANQRPISAQAMRAMLWESDESVDENAKTIHDKRSGTNLFTQKTAVLADADNISGTNQAAVETEVLSENPAPQTVVVPQATGDFDSERTTVRSLSGPAATQKPAFATRAILALVLALMAGSAIFYAYNPGMFGAGGNSGNMNAEPQLNTVTVSETNADSNATVSIPFEAANGNAANESSDIKTDTKTDVRQNPDKQTETTRQETKNQTSAGRTNEKGETGDGRIPPVPKPNEPMTSVENDEDGDDEPTTEADIPPGALDKMTPLQRQQLRKALEIRRQQREIERRKREQQMRQQPQPPN